MRLIGNRTYELDDVELLLYFDIRHGKKVTSKGDKNLVSALTRMRRNGLIENHGTRSNPEWRASDLWKTAPYNQTTTIFLPDGENNRDPVLCAFDQAISEVEEVLEGLRARREEYIVRMNESLSTARRTNQQWRKFS